MKQPAYRNFKKVVKWGYKSLYTYTPLSTPLVVTRFFLNHLR